MDKIRFCWGHLLIQSSLDTEITPLTLEISGHLESLSTSPTTCLDIVRDAGMFVKQLKYNRDKIIKIDRLKCPPIKYCPDVILKYSYQKPHGRELEMNTI
jgi:hypothetical protein